eukprot:206227_1
MFTIPVDGTSIRCMPKLECTAIHRIVSFLQHYKHMDEEIENDEDKLIQLYEETYSELLDDFIRVTTQHVNEIDDIYDMIINNDSIEVNICDAYKCNCSSRHNRNRMLDFKNSASNDVQDIKHIFVRNLFDKIHCYILHVYDFGYRIHKNDISEEITE